MGERAAAGRPDPAVGEDAGHPVDPFVASDRVQAGRLAFVAYGGFPSGVASLATVFH